MSVFLDILRCFFCCNDSHNDGGYRGSSATNSSARHGSFSNIPDKSESQQYQSNTSTITPSLNNRYPNYYNSSSSAESERLPCPMILEKTGKQSHNVKNSTPLQPPPPKRPQSSSKPVTPLPVQSTLPSHHFSSSSINASSSSFGSNSLPSTSTSTPRLRTTSMPSPFSSGLTKSSTNQLVSSSKLPTEIPKPSATCSLRSPSTPKVTSRLLASSPKPPPTSNPTLRPIPSNLTNAKNYLLDASSSLPLYLIPKNVEELIEKDIVPEVLKKPLSPLTYKPYFAALLYAEDFYHKKWSEYKLKSINLELQEITVHRRTNKKTKLIGHEKANKTFAAFEIDSIPERRPFLLSRDLVHARLSGSNLKPFQGFVHRVAKSNNALGRRNILLVDFGEDFYSRHQRNNKYDISFTFNRVCLKRAHQAIEDSSDSLFHNFLFPEFESRKICPLTPVMHSSYHQLAPDLKNAVGQISFFQSSPPYLMKGPPCILKRGRGEDRTFELSRTGMVVQAAVHQIYLTFPNSRNLICSPTNITCDELMISLKKLVPESDMFRAFAAFRDLGDVPIDILSSCDYNRDAECFTCPPLDELREYKIIFSTFMSSFRLHDKGLPAGHFSHIFLLDASAATEPETLVPLTKFATDATAVIVTGQTRNQPYWVRSDIARRHGLKISYFERLEESWVYKSLNPLFVTEVFDEDSEGYDRFVSGY